MAVPARDLALGPIATERVSDLIAKRLAQAIRDGVLAPGDRLPTEQELSREFGVGRTSVREGLGKLRALGLIESRKGLGAFVSAPRVEDPLADFARWTKGDPAAVEGLLEARVAIETLVAGLAAVRAREDEVAAMKRHNAEHEAAGGNRDVEGLVESDAAFHGAIVAAARNRFASRLYGVLIAELTDFRRRTLALPWAAERSARGHGAIIAAICERDPRAARAESGQRITPAPREALA